MFGILIQYSYDGDEAIWQHLTYKDSLTDLVLREISIISLHME